MSISAKVAAEDTKAPAYRWVVVITWVAVHTWGFLILESIGLLLPSIRQELKLSPVEEGWLGSSAILGSLLLSIPAGWLLSRFSPKRLTSITLLAGAALIMLQGWSPVFAVLLIGRFLYGMSAVARTPARTLLIKQWVPQREIVVVNALGNLLWGVVAIGFILIPVVLELLDDSWRNTFYLFGGISLGLALLWQVLGKERITPEYEAELNSQKSTPVISAIRHPELWVVGIGMVGAGITWGGLATFWPSLMLDRYQMSLTASASIITISGVSTALIGLAIAILVSKVGKKRLVLLLCGIAMALSSVGMLWTGSYPVLVIIALVHGVAWSFFPIVMTIPFELSGIKPREVAVAIGFLEAAILAGGVVGPILAGFLHDTTGDLRTALMTTSLLSLAMTFGALLLPRKWDQPALEERPATL